MIVIDTSVLVALRLGEDDAPRLRDRIAKEQRRLVPASCYLEFVLVSRLGENRHDWLRDLLRHVRAEITPIDSTVAKVAADAAERYGRGSGHRARLNFGDCFSYAVAKSFGAPLLYKGGDFGHTDIESALAP